MDEKRGLVPCTGVWPVKGHFTLFAELIAWPEWCTEGTLRAE
jgi:hypothetical protein